MLQAQRGTGLFEGEAGDRITSLHNRYGLTSQEARLALLIGGGATVRAAAERLGITVGTARQHLKRVFAKTDVGRQAELVLLLNRPAESAEQAVRRAPSGRTESARPPAHQ